MYCPRALWSGPPPLLSHVHIMREGLSLSSCVAPNTAPVYSKNLFKTAFCFSVCECMAQVWRVFHQTLFSGVLFAARPHGIVTTGCAEPEQTHFYSLYRVCVHCRTLAIRGKGPKKEANLSNQAQWIFLHSRKVQIRVHVDSTLSTKYKTSIIPSPFLEWLGTKL